jgi:hypothetical protein
MEGFVLARIAEHFSKQDALALLRDAAAQEEAGHFVDAIQLYTRAYRMWPELDSGIDNGLPKAVRAAAVAAGIDCNELAEASLRTEASPRYPVDATEQWLSYLDEHGYCVLAEVADTKEVAQARSLMWDYLESIPGTHVRREEVSTWGIDNDWLPSADNGLLGGCGFGQSAFCWHTRLLPKVKQAFASIWACEDLIVSFDGGNVFRPWERNPDWRTQGSWWHVDQNAFTPGRDGRKCVQGFVTFTDATPATGGLCVAPGSHKQHKEVCERAHAHDMQGDFVPVQAEDPVFVSGGKLVCAKAGDLVLWDSRCVHCNTPGVMKTGTETGAEQTGILASATSPLADASAPAELIRVAAYVCMTPAAWASPEVLVKRKHAFINNVSLSHCPHEYQGAAEAPPWLRPTMWSNANAEQRRMIVGASSPQLAGDARDMKPGEQ